MKELLVDRVERVHKLSQGLGHPMHPEAITAMRTEALAFARDILENITTAIANVIRDAHPKDCIESGRGCDCDEIAKELDLIEFFLTKDGWVDYRLKGSD